MILQNIYSPTVQQQLADRVRLLRADTKANWGKMTAAQMLAHQNAMFKIALDDDQKRPNAFLRFLLQTMVKKKLINDEPYKKNDRTAPEMVIHHQPDFKQELDKVLAHLKTVQTIGAKGFEQRLHPTFGAFSAKEWSNLFYKHMDHHLNQFGV